MLGLLISFLLVPADTVVLKPAVTVAVKQERKLDDLPSPSSSGNIPPVFTEP